MTSFVQGISKGDVNIYTLGLPSTAHEVFSEAQCVAVIASTRVSREFGIGISHCIRVSNFTQESRLQQH